MSPAGYWPQLRAAIEAGADSVYFGLTHFTARAKVGFTLAELPEVMRELHRRAVRGFVAFNTLVFDSELREAARGLAAIAEAGADAVIIQDAGVLALAREIAPDLEIHASTQMSVTDAAGARLAARLGAHRVTLARELSLEEIRAIGNQTNVELEVFVHGALCVAYSGQCFSSEAWGGRSANRGQCAQACRLPYEMYVDGRLTPLGDARYLLSPGDLCALHQIPELTDAGVSAFKIEGRYKDENYVAAATRAYRQAVDDAWAARPLSVSLLEEMQLEQVYSRGAGPYFVQGTNHQAVVRGRAGRHRGLLMGTVEQVSAAAIMIRPSSTHALYPLKPGDGVVFDAAGWRSPEEPEEGGRIFELSELPAGLLRLAFGRGAVNPSRIRAGDLIWRTDDPALERLLRPYTQAAAPVRKQAVRVHVKGAPGEPLRLTWSLEARPGMRVTVASAEPLPAALNRSLDEASLRAHLGRLGPTPYELSGVELELAAPVFAPASLLNQLRRDAVERLQQMQSAPRALAVLDPGRAVDRLLAGVCREGSTEAAPALHLLVRTPDQLDAAIGLRPASVTLDYLDLYGLKPSLERVREAGLEARVASPRILKPGEERIADFLLRLECPILVRPAGLLDALRGRTAQPLTGDFSLNAANVLSAGTLLGLGLQRITPTHDLNAAQVAALAERLGGARIEAIAYQHLPVFHTEHCVFCRFLSTGTTYKDCGRPCETHRVELGDVNGRRHPVLADTGCRNTVFGAEAQEASLHLEDWLDAGIRHFRLEFAHESPRQVRQVAEGFRQALSGEISFVQLSERIRAAAPQGCTQGSLYVPVESGLFPVLQ